MTPDYNKHLSRAMAYCAKGEKCEHDVAEKLQEWGADASDIQPIIDHLVEERFVDNARYARAYANDKLRFNQWGRRKISIMLASKRVDRADIDAALTALADDVYYQALVDLLTAKARATKFDDPYRLRMTIFAHAVRRGFEPSLINEALVEVLAK